MERRELGKWLIVCFFLFIVSTAIATDGLNTRRSYEQNSSPIKLNVFNTHVEIDNGLIKLMLSTPSGMIIGLEYKGIDNVFGQQRKEMQSGYWDIVWSRPDLNGSMNFDTIERGSFQVIANTNEQVELSFLSTWNASVGNNVVPLNIDKRFIVLSGSSGFYTYAIFEHLQGWPDLNVDEARVTFKPNQDLFHYMAISDDKQRIMPSSRDMINGTQLNYREAIHLTNPQNPNLKGEVDDKYQYSLENKDNRVHGWISSKKNVGFWVIMPSDEFKAGGPIKLDLTSHAGPTSLAVFFSTHYAGLHFGIKLRNGEPWKKVYGPIFVYLNSDVKTTTLWEDAKRQMKQETSKWPYDFPLSKDFPNASQRGTVKGRLLVRDRYMDEGAIWAKFAFVGLAAVGHEGSWQSEVKGYQFWTQTNVLGHFTIPAIRPGTYNLYAWVPGIIGNYKLDNDVIINPGSRIRMGKLVYYPPRIGPTLWEIGIPDRSAAEFFIPDPNPNLVNKLFLNIDKYRQYGLWDRYTDLYPNQDLVYTVGFSDYRKDWFFAHVNRKINNGSMYAPTTWTVWFNLTNVEKYKTYTLRLALASANFAEIQVRINNSNASKPLFRTWRIGRDNAIARHGAHGQYWLYSVNIRGVLLVEGGNALYLTQSMSEGPFIGVMYDYIRMEGPSQPKHYTHNMGHKDTVKISCFLFLVTILTIDHTHFLY